MPFNHSSSPENSPAPENLQQKETAESGSKAPDARAVALQEVQRAEQYALDIADYYKVPLTLESLDSLTSADSRLSGMPPEVGDALFQLALHIQLLRDVAESSDDVEKNMSAVLDTLLTSANEELEKLSQYFLGQLEYEPDVLHLLELPKLRINPHGEDPGVIEEEKPDLMFAMIEAVQEGEKRIRSAQSKAEQKADTAAAEGLLGKLEDTPGQRVQTSSVTEIIGKDGRSEIIGSSDMDSGKASAEAVRAGKLIRSATSYVDNIETTLHFLRVAGAEKQAALSVQNLQKLKRYTVGLVRLEQQVPSELVASVRSARERTDSFLSRISESEFLVRNESGKALQPEEIQRILTA